MSSVVRHAREHSLSPALLAAAVGCDALEGSQVDPVVARRLVDETTRFDLVSFLRLRLEQFDAGQHKRLVAERLLQASLLATRRWNRLRRRGRSARVLQ